VKIGLFDIVQWPGDEEAPCDPRIVNQVYAEHLDVWQAAEDLGYEYIFAAEHHFSGYGLCPDPYIMLAALARATKRIRLGAMVSVVPFHHPVRLAEQLAMVDVLSGGRLDVGFGRGSSSFEHTALHLDMDDAWERFTEGIEQVQKAWTTPDAKLDGRFYEAGPLTLWPRPLQEPHPPIWVTATSPATIEWTAAHGFGITTGQGGPEQIADRFKAYRDAYAAAGHDQADNQTMISRNIFVADSDEEARRLVEPEISLFQQRYYRYVVKREGDYVPESYRAHRAVYNPAIREGRVPKLEELIAAGTVVVGTPDTVIEGLRRLEAATGASAVLSSTHFGSFLTAQQALRSMELLTREVMPALEAAGKPER
jgi:luciferase family oxidoreductase group 1